MSAFKVEIEATIGYDNYSNVKPKVTLEGDNMQDLIDTGLGAVSQVSKQVTGAAVINVIATSGGKKTKYVESNSTRTLNCELTGTTLEFDKIAHVYDKDGVIYKSGSKFPDKFFTEFDKEAVLKQMIATYPTVKSADVADMWKLSGEASSYLGNAVHTTLENYMRNHLTGEVVRPNEKTPNRALSKNPLLRRIVENFLAVYGSVENVVAEAPISNDEFKLCGFVDLVKIVDKDKKICRIQDYKTDADIMEARYQKKDSILRGKIKKIEAPEKDDNTLLALHWVQLSFYAFIMQRAGWTVEGLDIFWLNQIKLLAGENPWEKFSRNVIDVSEGIING